MVKAGKGKLKYPNSTCSIQLNLNVLYRKRAKNFQVILFYLPNQIFLYFSITIKGRSNISKSTCFVNVL